MQFITLFAAATSVSAISANLLNLNAFEKFVDASPIPSALTEEEITKAEKVFTKLADMNINERVAVLNNFGSVKSTVGGILGGIGGAATGGLIGGAIGAHIGRKNAEKKAAGSLPKAA